MNRRRQFIAILLVIATLVVNACGAPPPPVHPEDQQELDRAEQDQLLVGVVTHDFDSFAAPDLPGERRPASLGALAESAADAYWIGSDVLDKALRSEHVAEYGALLAEGRVFVFLGLDEPNRLRSLFGLAAESLAEDSVKPDVVYLWEAHPNQAGRPEPTLVVGSVYLPETATTNAVLREALLQSWYHRGHTDHYFRGEPLASVGEEWRMTFGPAVDHWVPEGCGACRLIEHRTGWAMDPERERIGDRDMVAMRLHQRLIGVPEAGVDLLQVKSEAGNYQSINGEGLPQLRTYDEYWGQAPPEAGYRSRSDFSVERFEHEWDYDAGSDYAQGSSDRPAWWAYFIPAGTPSVVIPTYRRVEWDAGDAEIDGTTLTTVRAYE